MEWHLLEVPGLQSRQGDRPRPAAHRGVGPAYRYMARLRRKLEPDAGEPPSPAHRGRPRLALRAVTAQPDHRTVRHGRRAIRPAILTGPGGLPVAPRGRFGRSWTTWPAGSCASTWAPPQASERPSPCSARYTGGA